MIGRANRPESEITRRINSIRASTEMTFRGLLKAGEFDIKSDLRFRNLSGISFAGEDLRGIDFRGANLIGCSFEGALIEGARFERARLGVLGQEDPIGTDLTLADDWAAYKNSWIASNDDLIGVGEDFLPDLAIFSDAPILPLMVVAPKSWLGDRNSNARRIAASLDPLSNENFSDYELSSSYSAMPPPRAMKDLAFSDSSWDAVHEYMEWAREISMSEYRAPLYDEFGCLAKMDQLAEEFREWSRIYPAIGKRYLPPVWFGNAVNFDDGLLLDTRDPAREEVDVKRGGIRLIRHLRLSQRISRTSLA